MEASEHRCCDDLLTLSAPTGRRCCQRAGRALADRTMRAPVVEIADILAQDLLQMALIEDEHMVEALDPDRSHPALGDRVSAGRPERCANLMLLSVVNEKLSRLQFCALQVWEGRRREAPPYPDQPLQKRRNSLRRCRTGGWHSLRDQLGGCPDTARAASGV